MIDGSPQSGPTGLKRNATGLLGSLVVGVAAPAPAYTLAATLSLLVAIAAFQAPAILIVSVLPIALNALAFAQFARADPDPGALFSWVTRTFGPAAGFMTGWSAIAASTIVIGVLANTAAAYGFFLFDLDSAAASKPAVIALALVLIALMAWVSYVGIEASTRVVGTLVGAQVATMLAFGLVALVAALAGDGAPGSGSPATAWFSPFSLSGDALVDGLIVGVFAFTGWEAAMTLGEEARHRGTATARAALGAVAILGVVYVIVVTGLLSYFGADRLAGFEDESAFQVLAPEVLSTPLDKLVVISVLTAALGAVQASILAQARAMLSMSRRGALPRPISMVHRTHRTPAIATLVVAAAAGAWYLIVVIASESFLADSIVAIGLLVALYHAITGVACPVYFRGALTRSARAFATLAILPVLGSLVLGFVVVRTILDLAETGGPGTDSWLGVQPPLTIAIALVVAGVVLMAVRHGDPHGREFFAGTAE